MRRGTALIAAALAMTAALAALDGPLQGASNAGSGTIDFEFAFTGERASEILAAWDAEGELGRAGLILGLDFLYPLLYAAALSWACLAAGRSVTRRGRPGLARAAKPIAGGVWAAAGFDYAENLALVVMLLEWPGEIAGPWPPIAGVAAIFKFALVAVALVYALAGGLTARSRGVDPDPAEVDREHASRNGS